MGLGCSEQQVQNAGFSSLAVEGVLTHDLFVGTCAMHFLVVQITGVTD